MCLVPLFLIPLVNLLPRIFDLLMVKLDLALLMILRVWFFFFDKNDQIHGGIIKKVRNRNCFGDCFMFRNKIVELNEEDEEEE